LATTLAAFFTLRKLAKHSQIEDGINYYFQFKFFYAKPHFGSVDPATLVGQCTRINPDQIPELPTGISS
jgi:hypothetical protein